ncbi:hypothetical protein P1P75_41000, partial [Streptomyces sp. ID05-39B]|nr:hypothetical protein [Streptomyces sp. ID05-39B]
MVSGARNATPCLGRPRRRPARGDPRESAGRTALRLHTTTEPTRTRVYTLAHNPAYRLGWTVRGYLQSTYTDYHLGTESRRVPEPLVTTPSATSSADPTPP